MTMYIKVIDKTPKKQSIRDTLVEDTAWPESRLQKGMCVNYEYTEASAHARHELAMARQYLS